MLSSVVTDLSNQHQVTATLDSPALFSGTRSVEASSDEEKGRIAVRLLRTGPRSWATADAGVLRGAAPRFVAGRDRNGPISVGVEVAQPAAAETASGKRTVNIAYGDSQFVTNRFLEYLGNRDLALNSLNWLAREDTLVSARAKTKTPGKNFFSVSQAEAAEMFRAAVMIEAPLSVSRTALYWIQAAPEIRSIAVPGRAK